MVDIQTYTIEGPDGETDSVRLPADLVDMLREGSESDAQVVGDVLLQTMAQQAHVRVHHADGQPDPELEEINETAEDLFEERFGISLADALGHQH